MIKISIKAKVKLTVQGVAGVFVLLLGVYGVHHAQPYNFLGVKINSDRVQLLLIKLTSVLQAEIYLYKREQYD